MFIFGLEMDNYDFLLKTAKSYGLGGVIIFPRNLASFEEFNAQIETLEDQSGTPLIVAVDQEGGDVNRLEGAIPSFPSMSHFSRNQDKHGLRQFARTTAKHLKKLRINTNFVPVCDVLTNPANKLMASRSFGSNPELVADYACLLIEEFSSLGIVTSAKHFPGLGSASLDPHISTATSGISRNEFERIHWLPFARAVKADVPMVMTTHVVATELDSGNMATFSSAVVRDCLRTRLGFEGVVITDDLCMGAVAGDFNPGERALKALASRHDMVMYCHNPEAQKKAFSEVINSLDTDRIDQTRTSESLKRIARLKGRL